MTNGIPYSGDISVTSAGLPCIGWSFYDQVTTYYTDIGLFSDDNYTQLGAKCRSGYMLTKEYIHDKNKGR